MFTQAILDFSLPTIFLSTLHEVCYYRFVAYIYGKFIELGGVYYVVPTEKKNPLAYMFPIFITVT